ncbi:MAG TPA: HAMP domain-containing sensor histidine kinase [Gemmatimonadales bacterium]|nr:HAMP domain-containing sensor histidine kinase [Gemmatimonadales bacterium]
MHEVRGPAQAISLVDDLLDQGDSLVDPTLQNTLHTASARLRDVLDLLDRALRPPATQREPEPIPIRQLLELLAAVHASNHGPLDFDQSGALATALPAVRGVEDRLAHALLNLLMNAHEALAGGVGTTIRVSARVVAGGRMVELAMEDDGPGVSAAVRDRLFQPFVTTKQGRPLTGLGLAVTRMLVEEAGGAVRHEPTGSGAKFVVELPVW